MSIIYYFRCEDNTSIFIHESDDILQYILLCFSIISLIIMNITSDYSLYISHINKLKLIVEHFTHNNNNDISDTAKELYISLITFSDNNKNNKIKENSDGDIVKEIEEIFHDLKNPLIPIRSYGIDKLTKIIKRNTKGI